MNSADESEKDIDANKGMKSMSNENYSEQDRVFTLDEFKQFDRLSQNTNSRIPIFFCVDVSGSMNNKIGFFETRLSLLIKVMRSLLVNMKTHPELSERAVIGVVTYNNMAILHQSALDLGVLDINFATRFDASNQTIFSLGLRRTLQAIDQYRDSLRRSDTETSKPMLIFMTDGQPVGDNDNEIEDVYNDVWKRVQNNDLYVFPIGISSEANMSYVNALDPKRQSYQMIAENDFEAVFSKIESIVNKTKRQNIDEDQNTDKASQEDNTKDTGEGIYYTINELSLLIDKHTERK